jgi:hypothetical protein
MAPDKESSATGVLYGTRLDKAATLSALEELKTLPPNWSGYTAIPIDRSLIQVAKDWIQALPSNIIGTPKVVPMTRGRLQFEWHEGNRSLELEFESRDRIHYLKWDPDAGIEEEDVIPMDDVAGIHALLRWFAPERGNVSRNPCNGELNEWYGAVAADLRPEGAQTDQPGASSRDRAGHPKKSPERATQTGQEPSPVPPFQGSVRRGASDPGAMPRADLLRPLRGGWTCSPIPVSRTSLSGL